MADSQGVWAVATASGGTVYKGLYHAGVFRQPIATKGYGNSSQHGFMQQAMLNGVVFT